MQEAGPLKSQVREFWNRQSCDTDATRAEKFSRDYFEEIEAFRYRDQPFIHAFAQFSRYHGKQVLEVGFGAGTDFIQWLRAGAIVSGIDLTPEALANLTHRIQRYQLPPAESIQVADAENLPFPTDTFDLGYSFGVLHHSPDTEKALRELVRVVRPGGEIKVMLYNRHSFCIFKTWVKFAVLRGKPWKSWSWAIWNHMESVGTKAYTRKELKRMLAALPLQNAQVRTEITSADYLAFSAVKPLNWVIRAAIRLAGDRPGWRRRSDYESAAPPAETRPGAQSEIEFTGNRLGLFHCLSATKRLQ